MTGSKSKPLVWAVLAGTLAVLTSACQKAKPIPKPPEPVKQEFTSKEEGWPPRVKDRTNVTAGPAQETSVRLTNALAVQTRDAALQDQRVREQLGNHFAYIHTDEIEPEKGQTANGPLATRVTFFSYANNVAVLVRMSGLKVESVSRREGYQPPEGADEIKQAIEFASRDNKLRDKLPGLTGNAILTLNEGERANSSHRVLRVTFSQGDEDAPRFFAEVDLTDQRVLSAGPFGAENKERKP